MAHEGLKRSLRVMFRGERYEDRVRPQVSWQRTCRGYSFGRGTVPRLTNNHSRQASPAIFCIQVWGGNYLLRPDDHMRITTFLLILAVFFPGRIVAQANVNVPPDDPAYVYLDDLVARGLVTSDISATKPYSRGDFAQLIAEARAAYDKNLAARGARVVEYALQYLTDRFSDDIDALSADGASRRARLRLIDEFQLSYFNYKGERRTTAPDPEIDADIQPFIAYREGRTFREGQNLALESRHWFSLGDALGVYYQGRLFATDPRTSTGFDADVTSWGWTSSCGSPESGTRSFIAKSILTTSQPT